MAKAHLNEPSPAVTPEIVQEYERDGHVCIRGLIMHYMMTTEPNLLKVIMSWNGNELVNSYFVKK